ncbi:MAG: hypothetical protein A4E66_02132 [Syntrophus sp. PtaB.Bin001]|nr:MAG: hypothetical protein A4E66_02132 [Syntrophus sp. PtaB.Bin001]
MHAKRAVSYIEYLKFIQASDGCDYFPLFIFIPCMNKKIPENPAIVLMNGLHFHDFTAVVADCDYEVR